MCFCDDGIFPDFLVTEPSSASEEGKKKKSACLTRAVPAAVCGLHCSRPAGTGGEKLGQGGCLHLPSGAGEGCQRDRSVDVV